MPLSSPRSTRLAAGRLSRPLPAFAIAACLALALLGGCKKGDGDAQAKDADKGPDAIPVEVATVARRPIAASYSGTAPLEARGESQVVAKTSGVALQVLAQEGQAVRAGQVLVRIDRARPALQAAQAEAQVRKLEANYSRARTLAAQKMVSANDLDQLKYDLENARAVYNMARLELSYTDVVAPISGTIASRSIKPGNFVQINTPIFRIVDNSRLEATLNVPERDLETLKPGLPVSLQVDALPGKSFAGSVDRIAPVVDAGSGTFRVVCAFDGGGPSTGSGQALLQPGMFGRIRIDYDQRANALVIPRTALLDDESDPAVFVARGGKAARVSVKLGYTDGEWAEVLSGLKPGEQVVTAGKVALREGSAVQVLGAQAANVATKAAAPKPGAKQ